MSIRRGESLIEVEMLIRTEPTCGRLKWETYPQCCIKEAAGCGGGVCVGGVCVGGGCSEILGVRWKVWREPISFYKWLSSKSLSSSRRCRAGPLSSWHWIILAFLSTLPMLSPVPCSSHLNELQAWKTFSCGEAINCLFNISGLIPLKSMERCPVTLMEVVSDSHGW